MNADQRAPKSKYEWRSPVTRFRICQSGLIFSRHARQFYFAPPVYSNPLFVVKDVKTADNADKDDDLFDFEQIEKDGVR